MGNNCCQRSKNPQELQYGQSLETLKDQISNPQRDDLLNFQRKSYQIKEAEKMLKINSFDPSSHALPVALYHCINNYCIGLKPSIKEIYKISQNYSQGITKNYFDPKFLISEYGVIEIQSLGSQCFNSSQLSKQYLIEFQSLMNQVHQHPYRQEIDSLAFIVRKEKQSYAFSFKLNSFNNLSQKKEYVLHTLHPFVKEKNSYNTSLSNVFYTDFKGFDCGELIFDDIDEFYEYLDSLLVDEDEYENYCDQQQVVGIKLNSQNSSDQKKTENTIFIQLITFLSISRKSQISFQSEIQPFQSNQQTNQSFIDLLNTLECDDSELDNHENQQQSEYLRKSVFNNNQEKENKRFSYLNTKSTNRFSHKSPQKQLEILKSSNLQNQLLKQQTPYNNKQRDSQIK
ncbi:hypothetical protein TTHERM_00329940 (macronuclear) [Tetrahymena thermophila SB210]|uniref:Uncharacterized protein n=1 Tax=Tetrahymena thermophila (strain SB210) TaxID=312017 RepID=I7MMS5_TETTS|nr:hypothetical protein TTHERM_00329940 [Tetrahymena thermophila SB210]EAS06314.1 hypothetical protein TTHERM_00329940 [Tetrahymena thermophila SB210]|eukprot:XP_001026559.1 hypothetical protein TTHERM_00329940 [Tetrahymena thermophila SB210]